MAETGTAFESGQASLSLSEDDNDPKTMHSSNDNEELKKEEKQGFLMNGLRNSNRQVEIGELNKKEARHQIEVHYKTAEELLARLKISKAEREKYIEESGKTQAIIAKLVAENTMITSQLAESGEALDKFIHVVDDLKATKEALLLKLAELDIAKESKVAALREAELMAKALNKEKEKNKELLLHITELKEALRLSNRAVIDAEEKKAVFFAGIESELLIATEAALQSQEQIEDMRKQLEMRKGLENDLLEKTIRIDYLQLELKREKDQNISVTKSASDAINELKKLISDMEIMEKSNSEKQACIESLESDVKRLEEELQTIREAKALNLQVKKLNTDIQKMEDEMSIRSSGLEVEIATLKSELHKGRAQIAAAEAAEAKARSSLTGLYLAVQQLAIEAEKAKNELRISRLEADNNVVGNKPDNGIAKDETEEKDINADSSELCPSITISVEEYELLIEKAERADLMTQTTLKDESHDVELEKISDVDPIKQELVVANETISELSLSLEMATKRAEVAEEAKALLEHYLRKQRAKHQRKKSSSETPEKQEISITDDKPALPKSKARPSNFPARVGRRTSLNDTNKNENYVPLGKVLDMKF